jgi:Mitochondrial carrier protein
MAADFWAGYTSGAVGICVGNPLDVLKVQLQAGQRASIFPSETTKVRYSAALLKGMLLLICLLVSRLIRSFLEQVRRPRS